MTGVTILSQQTCYWFQIIGFICFIVGITGTIFSFDEEHIICRILCCILVLFGLYNLISPIPVLKETHYKVTIDDNVKMSELYRQYTVVKQEGKIYTVKENN